MNDRKLQYLMSLIAAPDGAKEVGAYLKTIGKALGVRKDAALAPIIGVPATTLANWKRRGAIPEDGRAGIAVMLVEKIATYTIELPKAGLSAREAVTRLLLATDGDPLQVGKQAPSATALALPGLFVLAELLIELSSLKGLTDDPAEVAELLQSAMWQFRHGDQFRNFR